MSIMEKVYCHQYLKFSHLSISPNFAERNRMQQMLKSEVNREQKLH